MTELQKQLLNEIKDTKVSVDTILPQSLESSGEPTIEGVRDEYNLTYDELIEDFIKFEKRAIMKPQTFDRLWS